MNILITGASGLVGGGLVQHLTAAGHDTFSLQRNKNQAGSFWKFDQLHVAGSHQIDAVVHLAGENIATGRWTQAKKKKIITSREEGTKQLAQFCTGLEIKPRVFFSASAIGYYGDRGSETVDETATSGTNFVAEVCRAWEQAAQPVAEAGIRVVFGRIGMVLSGRGGTLPTMLPSFKLGIAGVVGRGTQYISWVQLEDLITMIEFILTHDEIEGPVNLVAPAAVTNREFTKTLGKVLKRPTVLNMPAFAARTVFGQMADELILSSTRVLPSVLMRNGYVHRYANLEAAIRASLA
ncbi:MAG: TIGR01777 family oxidoreductase [Desulfofustis sp.]|nr:TIGR01777 family oxidoreductase [Desulfofustis sp.]MBT8353159.1 TIGR01777 family oxidoreductase [Desulfofustis sp.]